MPSDASLAVTSPTNRKIGMVMVVLGFILGIVSFLAQVRQISWAGIDFASVYSSSRCLIAACDPYSTSETMTQFLKQGGSLAEAGPPPKVGPFIQYFPGYPPSTLFYFVPLALIRWPVAWFIYLAIATSLYGLAAYLVADLCSQYTPISVNLCLALFLASGIFIFKSAQPGVVAIALCCIAVVFLLANRAVALSIVGFALSLTIKPHIGGLVLLYFLLATPAYRKRAWQIIAVTIAMCLPGLVWVSISPASHNWFHDYTADVHGMATLGHMSNPGPTNIYASHIADLQTIVSLIHDDPSFYNPWVWGFSLILLAAWVYLVLKLRPSKEKDLLCIAAIASFSLLPFYHRVYDTRILLLVFPALAILWQRNSRWGVAGLCCTLYMIFGTSDLYMDHSNPNSSLLLWVHGNRIWITLLERSVPLSCLLLTVFYLAVLYQSSAEHGHESPI